MDQTDNLSEKDLNEFKEIFDLVDTDHTGVISVQELRKLMAALHLPPTEQELEDVFDDARISPSSVSNASMSRRNSVGSNALSSGNHHNSNNTSGNSAAAGAVTNNNTNAGGGGARTINFTQFAHIMARRVQSQYTAEQLRGAFQLFESPDMPEGYVSTSVLAHALSAYGSQRVPAEEVERLIAAVDPEHTGRVNYYAFVDLVTS